MTIRKDKWDVLRKQKKSRKCSERTEINGEIKTEGKVCRKVETGKEWI